MKDILVGIDGSPASVRALEWALDTAELRGINVHVLHAFKTEYMFYVDIPATALALPRAELEAAAEAMVNEALESVEPRDTVGITSECVNTGDAAKELANRSEDFEMIVLGSRGRGTLAGLFLGSVAFKVLQLAACPVVVIPARLSDHDEQSAASTPTEVPVS